MCRLLMNSLDPGHGSGNWWFTAISQYRVHALQLGDTTAGIKWELKQRTNIETLLEQSAAMWSKRVPRQRAITDRQLQPGAALGDLEHFRQTLDLAMYAARLLTRRFVDLHQQQGIVRHLQSLRRADQYDSWQSPGPRWVLPRPWQHRRRPAAGDPGRAPLANIRCRGRIVTSRLRGHRRRARMDATPGARSSYTMKTRYHHLLEALWIFQDWFRAAAARTWSPSE